MEEQEYCEVGAVATVATAQNIKQIFYIPFHIMSGIRYGIPACCVFRFCLDTILFKQPAELRGGKTNKHGVYVPCGIFHKRQEG